MRIERDFLGEVALDDDFPFGINTFRAMENFAFSDDRIRSDLFENVVLIKKSAAIANMRAGLLDERVGGAVEKAVDEIIPRIGEYTPRLHPLQGGAGTSTNMAANELVANISLRNLGLKFGSYDEVNPLDHVNLSQSTNDVYGTAVRLTILKNLKTLHDSVERLLDRLHEKERQFASILKIGRTELQDAMPISFGQTFGAWADALSRFRWRLDKARDWVREINLGGTAVGTGINADRSYAMHVVDILRALVEEPVSLSRNLVDATQNIDQIVEVSGLIKTGAVSIKKMASDLRLLSSGPNCGLGEIILPAVQAGSSIMPGKVNPVMAEAAEQVCLVVIGNDSVISTAASESNLELPQFLPLVAHKILQSIELLGNLCDRLSATIYGIKINESNVRNHVERSYAVATLLTPTLGYDAVSSVVKEAGETGRSFIEIVRERKLVADEKLEKLLSPEIMASPGIPMLEED